MAFYAEVVNGVCATVTFDGTDALAKTPGYVALADGLSPWPGVGWSFDGSTWTPPAIEAQLSGLVQSLPAHLAQAQSDAQTLAGLQPGQAPTVAQVQAMQNHANGWVSLLQALQVLLVAQGLG